MDFSGDEATSQRQDMIIFSQRNQKVEQTTNIQEDRTTYRQEIKNPVFNFEKPILDVEQQSQSNILSGVFFNEGRVDNYLGSPKSFEGILNDRNLYNISTNQYPKQRRSIYQNGNKEKQKQADNQEKTMDKSGLTANFKGDSLIMRNFQQNNSLNERNEQSQLGFSEINDRTKGKLIISQPEPIQKGIEFLVIKNVKNFIVKMKKKSRSLLFKALSKPQFLLINDVSSSYDYYLENGYFNQKIIDVQSKLEELESKFRLNDNKSNFIKLIKLELSIFLIAHIVCCIYLKIGLEESETGKSWLQFYELQSASLKEQYLNSLYYCLITMTTIGYGDFTPKTLTEKSFILVVSVLACGVFAYTFSQISEIVKDQEKKKKEYSKNMQVVNREMNKKGISIPLQHKVRKYFEHLQKVEEKKSFMQSEMIEKLPLMLKQEVLLDTNKQILAKHFIFSKLSYQSIGDISLLFHQKNYFPQEVIFREGDMEDNLYFIWSGEVNISKQYSSQSNDSQGGQESTLRILKKKDFFGHVGFFINNPNPYSAKAKTFVNLSYIKRQDFLNVLQKFPQDYEKFCYYKDSISLYSQISFLETKCFSCGDYNHYLQQCPSVHLIASISKQTHTQNIKPQDIYLNSFSRKLRKYNVLLKLEQFNIGIAEYWLMKADNDDASILSDLNAVMSLQNNQEQDDQSNHISERDSDDNSEEKPIFTQFKHKFTHSTFNSRDTKKQNNTNNYNSNSNGNNNTNNNNNNSNFNNNNQNSNNNNQNSNNNNYNNAINHQIQHSKDFENVDITSEQHIQNIQELDPKQNKNLDLDFNVDKVSQSDVKTNTLNVKTPRNSTNDLNKLSKSDLNVLQDVESDMNHAYQDKMNSSSNKKEEMQIPSSQFSNQNLKIEKNNSQKRQTLIEINQSTNKLHQNQNMDESRKKILNMNQVSGNFDQLNFIHTQQYPLNQDGQKEEDIDCSSSINNSAIYSQKKNMRIHNLLIEMRQQKAKQIEQRQSDQSPYLFAPLPVEESSSNQIISPLKRQQIRKKNPLKTQTSLEQDLFSPELPLRQRERQATKKKSRLSKQFIPLENVSISSTNNNIYASQKEESESQRRISSKKESGVKFMNISGRQSLADIMNEQMLQMNTRNLLNYIQMMSDNKLIFPLFENRNASFTEFNRKKKSIIHNSTAITFTDRETTSPLNSLNKEEKRLSNKNKIQLQIVANAIKKNEAPDNEKVKSCLQNQMNPFFPVNEDIIRRTSHNMDIDLLIYRKQWLWLQQQHQQSQILIDQDTEICIESVKSYQIYFPQGNLENVINKFNKKQKSLTKKANVPKTSKQRHESKLLIKGRESLLTKGISQNSKRQIVHSFKNN